MNGAEVPTLGARLDALPIGRWHIYMILICVLSFMFDGFDTQVIGPILPKLIGEWKLTNAQVGMLGSAGFAGMALGSTLFGLLADIIGRLKVFPITLFWYALLSGACALTVGFKSLFVMRFVVGMGLGGLIPVVMTYLAEYVPSKKRGQFTSYTSLGFLFGTVLAFTAGFAVVVPYGWKWGFVLGILPAFLAPFLWRGLPESVRYLLNKGRVADAVKVVEGLEKRILGKVTVSSEKAIEIEGYTTREEVRVRYRDLFKGGLAKSTIMLSLLWFAMMYNSYSITIWLPIFVTKELGYGLGRGLAFLSLSALVGIVGYLVAAFMEDYWGRKKTVIFTFLLYGIDLYLLFSLGKNPTLGAVLMCLMFFANGGMWVSLYTYTPETFPTKVRATGTGFGLMFGRIGGICGPAVVGLMYAKFGIFGVLHVSVAILVVAIVVMLIIGKETKGKTLEQIAMQQLQASAE